MDAKLHVEATESMVASPPQLAFMYFMQSMCIGLEIYICLLAAVQLLLTLGALCVEQIIIWLLAETKNKEIGDGFYGYEAKQLAP